MADFLKDNFPSLKNKIKNIKGAISDKEREFLQKIYLLLIPTLPKQRLSFLKEHYLKSNLWHFQKDSTKPSLAKWQKKVFGIMSINVKKRA